MASVAVNIAVIDTGKILLTQREDFHTWVLPSGAVEQGESLAQAAIREVEEETGIQAELTWLVGMYVRTGSLEPSYTAVFAARPAGGALKLQAGETIDVKWFSFEELPSPLHMGQARRIRDAIDGAKGLVVFQEIRAPQLPERLTKQELYALRDRSGLPRQEFYLQIFENAQVREIVEVGSL